MDKIIDKLKSYFGAFEIGVYDEAKGQVWRVAPVPKSIPYLKAENANGAHVFMRPRADRESYFILADDINRARLERDHKEGQAWKPGRLVVETSPGNFQVWIRSARQLAQGDKAYWLRRMGSDPGAGPAGRWGRCPGFRNRKAKYETAQGFPLAKLIWVDWVTAAEIPAAPQEPKRAIPLQPLVGGVCHEGLTREHYRRGGESETDFAYALALLRRGVTPEEVRRRIEAERTDWRHHHNRDDYLARTIRRAQEFVGA